MDEGLIGYSQFKEFVFSENEEIVPVRRMESLEPSGMELLVIDHNVVIPGYTEVVPARTWESLGVTESSKRLVFVVASIGGTPEESTASMLAPILVNYESMTARQVILTDRALPVRQPLM